MDLDRGWAHESRVYRALGHAFGVRTDEAELGEYLARIFGDLAESGRPDEWYSVVDVASEGGHLFRTYFGSDLINESESVSLAVATLLWHVNQEVVRRTVPRFTVLHAAAAGHDGGAVLLPAAMESGKTTLVAGLVAAGLDYLTDEAVALEHRAIVRAHPYPKALSVDRGSWQVLARLAPAYRELTAGQWQVPAGRIRAGPVAAGAMPVRMIIAPQYRASAATALEPVSRASMLAHLSSSTFEFAADPRRNLAVLEAAVRQSACYNLTVGDHDQAVEAVLGALQAAAGSVHAH